MDGHTLEPSVEDPAGAGGGKGTADGGKRGRSRGSSLLMGFAGGLVPSPSAVVVLLGAGALGQAWFGVLLVIAYGLGLAVALIAIGLLVVYAGDRIGRLGAAAEGRRFGRAAFRRLHRLAPVGTAAVVVVVGATIALRGMAAAVG